MFDAERWKNAPANAEWKHRIPMASKSTNTLRKMDIRKLWEKSNTNTKKSPMRWHFVLVKGLNTHLECRDPLFSSLFLAKRIHIFHCSWKSLTWQNSLVWIASTVCIALSLCTNQHSADRTGSWDSYPSAELLRHYTQSWIASSLHLGDISDVLWKARQLFQQDWGNSPSRK